jgi:hypothetical protein
MLSSFPAFPNQKQQEQRCIEAMSQFPLSTSVYVLSEDWIMTTQDVQDGKN